MMTNDLQDPLEEKGGNTTISKMYLFNSTADPWTTMGLNCTGPLHAEFFFFFDKYMLQVFFLFLRIFSINLLKYVLIVYTVVNTSSQQ